MQEISSGKPGKDSDAMSMSARLAATPSLPAYQTIVFRKERRLWRGFLKKIVSLDQLLEKPGLYPWYASLSMGMKKGLRAHVKQNLPEGSLKEFDKKIQQLAQEHAQKYRREIIDKDYILAETRKLEDDSDVVVTVPRKELCRIVNLMFAEGHSNNDIAQILGLSLETVTKFNRPENIGPFLSMSVEDRTIMSIRAQAMQQLWTKLKGSAKNLTANQLVQVIRLCNASRGPGRPRNEGTDEELTTSEIAHRHETLLRAAEEQERAGSHDRQIGETGGTESGS